MVMVRAFRYSVIEQKPALFRFDRRCRNAYPFAVPHGLPRIHKHAPAKKFPAPEFQVFHKIYPNIHAALPMEKHILSFYLSREKRRVFIVNARRRNQDRLRPIPLPIEKIASRDGCKRHTRRIHTIVRRIAHIDRVPDPRKARVFASRIPSGNFFLFKLLAWKISGERKPLFNLKSVA